MGKKRNILAEISKILKSSDITNRKECVEAYRGINAMHPIEWESFESIIKKNDLDKIPKLILATKMIRKQREDSRRDGNYYRISDKYKGRKREKKWKIYKDVEAIVNFKNLADWQQTFGISKDRYFLLLYKCLSSLKAGKEVTPDLIKEFGQKAVSKMWGQIDLLFHICKVSEKALKEAKEKNNTLLLNTAKKIFGKDHVFSVNIGKQGKGSKINDKTIAKRIEKVRRYINFELNTVNTGTFYERDEPTYCYHLARLASYILRIPYQIEKPEHERERAILKARKLILEYRIHPVELQIGRSLPETYTSQSIIPHFNFRTDLS